MSTGLQHDSSDDICARDFLAGVLGALDADDRRIACDYALTKSDPWALAHAVPDARGDAEYLLKSLAEILRDDTQINRGSYTKHLRGEARDWIVWGTVFGVAQHDLEVRYADFRKCARWAPTPKPPRFSFLQPEPSPIGYTTREDERLMVLRLRNAVQRSIEALDRVPKPRTAKLVQKQLVPHSPVLLIARLAYELHLFFLPVLCVAYRIGGLVNAVASLEQVRMGLLTVAVLSPIAWLLMVYDNRAICSPSERATSDIERLRASSRQWSLLWKTLLALTERVLADEDMDEVVLGNMRRIFDLVDPRMTPYHPKYGPPYPGKTTLESTHGSILSLEDGHELMVEIVSRISSFIPPEDEDKEDHTSLRDASTAVAVQDPQARHRAEMEAVLLCICNALGFHDPFFKILGPASYTGIPWLRVEPATRYSNELTESIYDVVAALQGLEPFPTTLQNMVRNTHLRLAWVGGLGRAQADIQAHIELHRREPTRENLQHLSKIIGHYLSALSVAPPPSSRDLLTANLSADDRRKLIATEAFKPCRYALAHLPLFIVPTSESRIVEGVVGLAYNILLRVTIGPSGDLALKGLYDLATGYCRSREVHKATNAAARLERLAQYHILGWKALQVAIDEPTSDSESTDYTVRMLMDSVLSAAQPSIQVSLARALDGKRASFKQGKVYSQANVVREIIDERYPAFRTGKHLLADVQ
ncbi:uncharacterized protein SCHCODRAFT_02646001 [Schizophyllum commune H4-8]|uniref:uncharacterized protein n=1 Tax=Schizophyllum commune (strain H4-8 / FGSC 9210) TaxID=578458 RepID=UPI00215F0365|nr:uncharacterized protein SCHCODRAFT_02646001 [Schizophyllum commune H4-8]KAI5836627.1 hypothetical protein SCHCODRAFT_02646001 [Schizophyllum commune H4-8]